MGHSDRGPNKRFPKLFSPTFHPMLLRVNYRTISFFDHLSYARFLWFSIPNQSVAVWAVAERCSSSHFPPFPSPPLLPIISQILGQRSSQGSTRVIACCIRGPDLHASNSEARLEDLLRFGGLHRIETIVTIAGLP